jgi:hypothetical protein
MQLHPGESKPLRLTKLDKPHVPTSKQSHLSSVAPREDAELGRGGLTVAARAMSFVSLALACALCVVIFRVVLLFIQLHPGESKPPRPKKLDKPHGPTSKQSHLSSVAPREDAEVGRGGLPVAARADLESKEVLVKATLVVDEDSAADSVRDDLPV